MLRTGWMRLRADGESTLDGRQSGDLTGDGIDRTGDSAVFFVVFGRSAGQAGAQGKGL